MTDQEFIELLNQVAKKAKPFHNELAPIDDMNANLADVGLDSLDTLMCIVYLCEIYDVEDEKSKEMTATTPRECLDFLEQWGRRKPESLEAAVGMIK